MKSNQKKMTLKLEKKAIAKLDDAQLKTIQTGAGAQELFTSIFHCSKGGFTCQCQTLACNFSDHCTSISLKVQ